MSYTENLLNNDLEQQANIAAAEKVAIDRAAEQMLVAAIAKARAQMISAALIAALVSQAQTQVLATITTAIIVQAQNQLLEIVNEANNAIQNEQLRATEKQQEFKITAEIQQAFNKLNGFLAANASAQELSKVQPYSTEVEGIPTATADIPIPVDSTVSDQLSDLSDTQDAAYNFALSLSLIANGLQEVVAVLNKIDLPLVTPICRALANILRPLANADWKNVFTWKFWKEALFSWDVWKERLGTAEGLKKFWDFASSVTIAVFIFTVATIGVAIASAAVAVVDFLYRCREIYREIKNWGWSKALTGDKFADVVGSALLAAGALIVIFVIASFPPAAPLFLAIGAMILLREKISWLADALWHWDAKYKEKEDRLSVVEDELKKTNRAIELADVKIKTLEKALSTIDQNDTARKSQLNSNLCAAKQARDNLIAKRDKLQKERNTLKKEVPSKWWKVAAVILIVPIVWPVIKKVGEGIFWCWKKVVNGIAGWFGKAQEKEGATQQPKVAKEVAPDATNDESSSLLSSPATPSSVRVMQEHEEHTSPSPLSRSSSVSPGPLTPMQEVEGVAESKNTKASSTLSVLVTCSVSPSPSSPRSRSVSLENGAVTQPSSSFSDKPVSPTPSVGNGLAPLHHTARSATFGKIPPHDSPVRVSSTSVVPVVPHTVVNITQLDDEATLT